jgi:ferredoxin
LIKRIRAKTYRLVDRFMRRPRVDVFVNRHKNRLWVLPPVFGFRRRTPRYGAWPDFTTPIPPALQSSPGIPRIPAEEERAAREAPLRDWLKAHKDTYHSIHTLGWAYHLPTMPHRLRINRAAEAVPTEPPASSAPAPADSAELTRELKELAAEIGISACGVAEYDPKYTFQEYLDRQVGTRVVICSLESDWASTQTAPSVRAEKGKLTCSAELVRRMGTLQQFLVDRGYRARQNRNEIVQLHYAVEAGLGQLGLNGQVLTPAAGSRCRMSTIVTDAPLVLDAPRDFGVPKICDACQICVRRCPSGAIPLKRAFHRGIEKSKINSARCAPVVAKAHHCAVCMKVCPVQRYGLTAVIEHYTETGAILGKGTSELESYDFEGRVYGPEERPVLRQEWFDEVPWNKDAGTPPFPPLAQTSETLLVSPDDGAAGGA